MANGAPTPGNAERIRAGLPVGSADQILQSTDVREDVLEVPEWGCSLRLRGFRLGERLEMEDKYVGDDGLVDEREMVRQYLLHGIVEPELDEEAATQIVEQKAHHVVQRVFNAIALLNAGDSAAVGSAVKSFLAEPDDEQPAGEDGG